MKKFILLTGAILILLNFISFLIFDFYRISPMISSQISLLLSLGVIYHVAFSSLPDGFKISLKYGLKLTGSIRFFLALFITMPLTNSLFLWVFIVVLALEFFIIASMRFVTKYSKN